MLKEKINALTAKVTSTLNDAALTNCIIPENEGLEGKETKDVLMPAEIETLKLEVDPKKDDKQQHYYIVKELLKVKIKKEIISTNEFEFTNHNLYTSKAEARLFYDNKMANLLNNDANSFLQYELYIVNNVFYDVKKMATESNISTNAIKRYLLIDTEGKEQTEGRNFESFALRAASHKMSLKHNSLTDSISTKNRFLDGDYKD